MKPASVGERTNFCHSGKGHEKGITVRWMMLRALNILP